jgi:rhodanese-related sulfurtransferase
MSPRGAGGARGLALAALIVAIAAACREDPPREAAGGTPRPTMVADTQVVRDSLGREIELVFERPAPRIAAVEPRKGSRDPDRTDVVGALPPRRALELMRAARPRWFVIDLRREETFLAEGYIPGAYLVPHEILEANVGDLKVRVDQTVLVYDEDGREAREAARLLASYGFPIVRWIEGGFAAWRAAELPIEGGA